MANRRFEAVRQLFLDALDRPEIDREAFVRERAGADAVLGAEALALLREHTEHMWVAADAPFAPEPAPAAIGPYRVIRELGRGGMGVVYLAQRGDEPPVAVKRAHGALDAGSGLARFQREVATLAALDHPAIARFVDSGAESTPRGERPWFAMEYVEGTPLRTVARSHDPSPSAPLELLAELGDALHHAHERGLIHRDVKPSNILVRPDGRPCLLDFGVARRLRGDGAAGSELTVGGLVLGTTPYMSPEQARGVHESVDARSDLYSLAVTGFELLTGELPHTPTAATHSAILLAIVTQAPRLIRDVRRDLPRSLERVFARALARDPAQRYPDAGAFAADLRRVARGEAVTAPGLPLAARVRRRARWHRVALAVLGLLAAAALAPFAPRAWHRLALERDPGALAAEISATLDRIDPSVRHNDRTILSIDAAAGTMRALLARLDPVADEPWAADLRRGVHWRLAELYIWRAEMSADRADHRECLANLAAMRRLIPATPRRTALRDSTGTAGKLAGFTMLPGSGLGLMAANYSALAQMERPAPHLAAARRLDVEAVGVRLDLPANAPESVVVARAIANRDSSEAYAIALHGLGSALVESGLASDDRGALQRGLDVLRRADRPAPEPRTQAPAASLHHSMGMAYTGRARLEARPADVDSALRYFRRALAYRRASPGNLSYYDSRRGATEALRVRAALVPASAATALEQAAGLLAGDLPSVRPDAHPSHRAALELQLARVKLDQAERGLAGATPAAAETLLARAAAVFDPSRFPYPAAQVRLERARAARLAGGFAAARAQLDGIAADLPAADAPSFAGEVGAERRRLERAMARTR